MKKKTLILPVLALLSFALSTCNTNDYNEDFDILEKELGAAGGGCPVGKWASPTCGGRAKLIFFFGSDGDGYTSNPDCNGICSDIIFRFHYTVSGDKISYSFFKTDDVICNGVNRGAPTVPAGNFTITYTCSNDGNQLTTQTTGSQSSATFTKQ